MRNKRHMRKAREGRVCSSKSDKTIVVLIERRVRHPLYGKEIKLINYFDVLVFNIFNTLH